MLTSLRRAVEGAYQGGSFIILAARFLKAEQGIGMTNEAVTPYAGTVIHHRLHKSIIEHCPCTGCKKTFRTLEKTKSLANFLSGLFYVFIAGEAAVKLDSKQFGAAESLCNLILESDF